jgi:hypothetical protein
MKIISKNPYTVYLAGKMDTLTYDEIMEQRERIKDKLKKYNIQVRNPLRGKEGLKNVGKIESGKIYAQFSINEIVQRDLRDVELSNAVLVMTGDTPSWGTVGEFYYATWVTKTPTLVICKRPSLWVEKFATKVVPDEEIAIKTLYNWSLHWDNWE